MNGGVPFAVDILREISNPGADKIFISYVLDKDNEWIFLDQSQIINLIY